MARVESAIVMWSHTDALIVPARVVESTACDFVWLLDVEVSGRVYRFSDRQVEATTEAGDVLLYRTGLSELIYSTSANGAVDLSIPVQVSSGVLWGELVEDDYRVERAPATLRRWNVGTPFEASRIIVDGRVEGVRYGGQLEPISFSIRRPGNNNGGTIPSGGMVIDETTWPGVGRTSFEIDPKIIGAYYPIVLGSPGVDPSGTPVASTEALAVEVEITPVPNDTEKLLIAGHLVVSTSVTIYDYTDAAAPEAASCLVQTTEDLAGRTVSFVTPNDPLVQFTSPIIQGRVYYAGWQDGGGLRNPFGLGAIRGAGDIIEWIITRWTSLQFDASRFEPVKALLNLYLIDCWINDPIDPVEWLMSALIPLLPAVPRNGVDGLYFEIRRPGLTKADAVFHFDTSKNCDRTSEIEIVDDDVVNEITVEYCPDRVTGRFRRRVIVGPDATHRSDDEIQLNLGTDSRIITSYRSNLSVDYFKQRFAATLEAPVVCDRATATRIGQDVIDLQALPRRVIDLALACEFEDRISIGDIVLISDNAVENGTGITEQLAEVLDVVVGGPTVPAILEILDDPVIG
ncbi:MAG: hypothetical protein HRU00_16530 [Myxococcales bacterium]|nr:hypothetical protein [Myxococcales bacterium]